MLRKLFSLFFLCLLPHFSAAVLYSNVLANPGFESGTSDTICDGWTRFGNGFRYDKTGAHGGSYVLAAWGNWWPASPPAWNGSGAYQEYPASRGQMWEASVWALAETPITGRQFAAVNIEFHNAAGQTIFTASSLDRITNSMPTGQWHPLKVRARATLNTASVRIIPIILQSPDFEGGAAWFDDCALYTVPTNFIRFADRDWIVLDQWSTPGDNYYSTNCVSVDTNGWLHMELKKINGVWHCPFIEATQSLGFGDYRWHVGNKLERIDSNLVVGLFTYAQESVFNTNHNEVDIEVSRAFEGTETNCLVYTVQPYNIPGNSYSHPLETTNDLTTHRFVWRPDRVDWQTYYGHTPEPENDDHFIAAWRFEGRGIPIETNEVPYINLWLFFTNAPYNTQAVEMIIHDFRFTPFNGFLFTDDFDDDAMSNAWTAVGDAVRETNGCLIVEPVPGTGVVGYATAQTVHRNERGTEYIFSAHLHAITAAVRRAGEDVRALMTLSAETSAAVEAPAAFILQGRYDADADSMAVEFFTKTTSPGANGTLRFDGALTNVTGLLASGDVEMQVRLDNVNYRIEVRDVQGQAVSLSTNAGSTQGAHGLGERLCYGYWTVGSQNSDSASQGAVAWSRAAVGIGGQAQPFTLGAIETPGSECLFACTGFFDTRYTVERTTNLALPFIPFITNAAMTRSSIVLTGSQDDADGMYYRVKLQ